MPEYAEERSSGERRRITDTFVELTDTLADGFDIVGHLRVLADRCVELLPVTGALVLLTGLDGRLRPAAGSEGSVRLSPLSMLSAASWTPAEAGPCVDCARSGVTIANAPLDAAITRWPEFAARARQCGYAITHAIPMRCRNTVVGVLSLFSGASDPIGDADLGLGQAMADLAAIGITQRRALAGGAETASRLREALEGRILVEQATGILAERMHLSMDDAFAMLREHTGRNGLPLPDVARAVVEGDDEGEDEAVPDPGSTMQRGSPALPERC